MPRKSRESERRRIKQYVRRNKIGQRKGAALHTLPVTRGPRDEGPAWEYLSDFLQHEAWVDAGRDPAVDISDWPFDFQILARHWPDSLEFYRHSMVGYLERLLSLNPRAVTLRSVLVRLRASDPDGFREFLEMAWSETEAFAVQSRNALGIMKEQDERTTKSKHLRDLLSAYGHIYEIDYLLWFIGVMGRGVKKGKVNASAFGGPDTSTNQAALIAQVAEGLKGSPLERLFSYAYDPELRNAVAHNSYEIKAEGQTFSVVNRQDRIKWDYDAIVGLVDSSTRLLAAVVGAVFTMKEVYEPADREEHSQSGILHTVYGAPSTEYGNLAVVEIYQLWCFRDIDPFGRWFDKSVVEIDNKDPHPHPIKFTEDGESSASREGDGRWAYLTRFPIAPSMRLGFPEFELADGTPYEIIGPADEHLVPLHGEW